MAAHDGWAASQGQRQPQANWKTSLVGDQRRTLLVIQGRLADQALAVRGTRLGLP